MSDDAFLKGIGDIITALKLIDDTQVAIQEEFAEMNEQLENIANNVEKIEESLEALFTMMDEKKDYR